jgi:hypothetical protein
VGFETSALRKRKTSMTLLERSIMGLVCKMNSATGHFYKKSPDGRFHLYYVDADGSVTQLDEHEGETMKPGSVVELKIPPAGKGARVGARAIVVDGQKEYPKLHKQLLEQVAEEHLSDFIWVRWDRDHPHHGDQDDGAYAAARFELIEEKAEQEPPNNDGRITCWWCGAATKKTQGFSGTWDVCEKCGR